MFLGNVSCFRATSYVFGECLVLLGNASSFRPMFMSKISSGNALPFRARLMFSGIVSCFLAMHVYMFSGIASCFRALPRVFGHCLVFSGTSHVFGQRLMFSYNAGLYVFGHCHMFLGNARLMFLGNARLYVFGQCTSHVFGQCLLFSA